MVDKNFKGKGTESNVGKVDESSKRSNATSCIYVSAGRPSAWESAPWLRYVRVVEFVSLHWTLQSV